MVYRYLDGKNLKPDVYIRFFFALSSNLCQKKVQTLTKDKFILLLLVIIY